MTDISVPSVSEEMFRAWWNQSPAWRKLKKNSSQSEIDEASVATGRWLIECALIWATPIVAQQAADAELEACKKFVLLNFGCDATNRLHVARRWKPKSKLQLAEELLERHEDGWVPSPAQWNIIREGLTEGRRALESIPDEPPTP